MAIFVLSMRAKFIDTQYLYHEARSFKSYLPTKNYIRVLIDNTSGALLVTMVL